MSSPEVVNEESQNLHLWGFVPVWVFTWFWNKKQVKSFLLISEWGMNQWEPNLRMLWRYLQRCQGLESPFANWTFVRPLLRVGLHVTRQQVSLASCVVAVPTHVRLSRLEPKKSLAQFCSVGFLTIRRIIAKSLFVLRQGLHSAWFIKVTANRLN